MKKNSGISTIVVTGMAAFVSIFAMILLIVLRSTIGGGKDTEKNLQEAKDKYEAIKREFDLNASNANLDVYTEATTMATVFISSDKYVIMWREINGANSGNINNVAYQTAMLYPDEIKSDDEKVAFAKTQVVPIVKGQVPEAKGNQKVLATEVSRLNIGEDAGELVLRVMIGYKKDKNSNGNYQPTDYRRAFSDEAKTYRAAHPQE
jgi:hypothetical protein